jgi:hypothetical protein
MTRAETNPVFEGPGTAYLNMAELREACRGRETEILDKLGVPYRSGNPGGQSGKSGQQRRWAPPSAALGWSSTAKPDSRHDCSRDLRGARQYLQQ